MQQLWELASVHIYFQILYVHCRYRQTAMYIQNDRGSTENELRLWLKNSKHLYSN